MVTVNFIRKWAGSLGGLLTMIEDEKKSNNQKKVKAQLREIARFIINNANTVATKSSSNTRMRNHYTKYDFVDRHYIDKYYYLNDEESKEKKDKATKSKSDKLENPIRISKDEILDLINYFRSSSNVKDKILMLIMTTGRRLVDVLKVTPIPKEDKKNKDNIIITKISKNENNKHQVVPFSCPLLIISHEEMVQSWEFVRDSVGDDIKLDNKKLTNLWNGKVNRSLKKSLPTRMKQNKQGTEQSFTSHLLRKIYANLAFKLIGSGKKVQHVFLTKVLGHKAGSTSYENYSNLIITDIAETKSAPDKELLRDVLEVQSDVKTLTTRFDNLNWANIPSDVNPQIIRAVKHMIVNDVNITQKSLKLYGQTFENRGKKFGSTMVQKLYNSGIIQKLRDSFNNIEPEPDAPEQKEEKEEKEGKERTPKEFKKIHKFARNRTFSSVNQLQSLSKQTGVGMGRPKLKKYVLWRTSINSPVIN